MKIQTQRETFSWRLAESDYQLALPDMPTNKLYRGFNLDTTRPGFEAAHALLPQMDHPDFGKHLLDGLESHPGLGRHWTPDPAQAERFSLWPNSETGRGGNLQAILEGEWGGGGEDYDRTDTQEFDEHGDRIRSFPEERERTLLPGANIRVTGLHVRPYDDAYWNGTGDASILDRHKDSPWHQVLSTPSSRKAAVI